MDYEHVVDVYSKQPAPSWVRHECVFPGWDNSPRRRDQRALIVLGNTPERYEQWLRTVYERASDRGGVVFVNAWNEWAEDAHLEPDVRWGDAFLRATARVVLGGEPSTVANDGESDSVLIGPTFAELYLGNYERYVHARRRLIDLDATIRREVEHRTARLREELKTTKALNRQLTERLDELSRRQPLPWNGSAQSDAG